MLVGDYCECKYSCNNLSDDKTTAFQENTYKISASAPTGVPEGTLWFDTTADTDES